MIFSNGGHRRSPAIEIQPSTPDPKSSIKIHLYEEFLSGSECDNLIKAHKSHIQNTHLASQSPRICFQSIEALRYQLTQLKQRSSSFKDEIIVSENEFAFGKFNKKSK